MGGKELTHEERVEAEARATIKRVLTELEEASERLPLEALHPYEFNGRRKRVMRAIWTLVNTVRSQPGAELTSTYECPHCKELFSITQPLNA